MVRKGFCMRVHPDAHDEYEKRHNELWPEMEAELKKHGVITYSIFLNRENSVLFGYLEIQDEALWQGMAATPVNRRWWRFMKDIMEVNPDDSPVTTELKQVFCLDFR